MLITISLFFLFQCELDVSFLHSIVIYHRLPNSNSHREALPWVVVTAWCYWKRLRTDCLSYPPKIYLCKLLFATSPVGSDDRALGSWEEVTSTGLKSQRRPQTVVKITVAACSTSSLGSDFMQLVWIPLPPLVISGLGGGCMMDWPPVTRTSGHEWESLWSCEGAWGMYDTYCQDLLHSIIIHYVWRVKDNVHPWHATQFIFIGKITFRACTNTAPANLAIHQQMFLSLF